MELALRRDRSPEAYRETLLRMAQQVNELMDLTGDLAVLGDPDGFRTLADGSADLDAMAAHLSARYDPARLRVRIAPAQIQVAGHEKLLTRALRLVLDHALRYHAAGASIQLRTSGNDAAAEGGVHLLLDAAGPGFSRHLWTHLADGESALDSKGLPGLLSLRTAASIVRLAGGTISIDGDDGAATVRIGLRRFPL